jgi:hypothetical protein
MEELQIEKAYIRFDENNFHISEFRIDELDLAHYLNVDIISITYNPLTPTDCLIQFPQNFEFNFKKILEIIDKLNEKNKCISANVASFLFSSFWKQYRDLILEGKHIIGIELFKKIFALINELENERLTIHKGALYYWLSLSYLLSGNIEVSFAYLFNALEEDKKLESICSGYPENSPSYLTATLSEEKNNFMYLYVKPVRNWLQTFIDSYNSEFSKSLSIEKLFDHFQKRKSNFTIFLYFIFNIWSVFEYQKQVSKSILNNDYMKLKNSSWFFNFCLIIDILLTNFPLDGRSFADKFYNFINLKNWMDLKELKEIIKVEKVASAYEDPDLVISKFLKKYIHNGNPLQNEIRYLIIAYNIRNFSAHNVKPQKCFVEKFEEILKILLFDIFVILEEYK